MSSNRCRSVLLLCAALLLALAVGALSARQDTNTDEDSFDLEVSPSHYKHRGPPHEHRSGDSYDGPDHGPYDRYGHDSYDRPPHRHGRGDYAYEGPSHRHHSYRDEEDYGSYGGKDPSRHRNGYGDYEGDFFYEKHDSYPKQNYYAKPTICDPCPANTTACPGFSPNTYQCLDLTSPLSCGECGKVCPAKSQCINKQCVCDPGTTSCAGECVDITSDPRFCGDCGNPCNTTTAPFCVNSTCTANDPCAATPETPTACFPSPDSQGTCTDLNTDPNACGACNRKCNFLSANTCTNGECCVGNGGSCRLGLQCCDWNPLSLIPLGLLPPPFDNILVVPTAKCEGSIGFPIVPGKCCKGPVVKCDNVGSSAGCCEGLTCQSMDVGLIRIGNQCQPPGCKKSLARCTGDAECCAGHRCTAGICVYIPFPSIP